MKQAEALRILAKYSEAYPATRLSKEGRLLYSEKLSKFSVEQLEKAMDALLEKCRYFPTIAEIFSEAEHFRADREAGEPECGTPEWDEWCRKKDRELFERFQRGDADG